LKGHSEFLFPYTPPNTELMVTCTAIVSAYEESNTAPTNMEAITKAPFGDDGPELSFIARVLTDGDLKKILEANYLYNKKAEHGLILMVPNMTGAVAEEWEYSVPIPTDMTEVSVDTWIQSVASLNGAFDGALQG